MKDFLTRKWERINPRSAGDFLVKNSDPYYGIIQEKDGSYILGTFNENRKENGCNVSIHKDALSFAKFIDGEMVSPHVKILNEPSSLSIMDEKENDKYAFLEYDFKEDVLFYTLSEIDSNNNIIYRGIEYDFKDGSIKFQRFLGYSKDSPKDRDKMVGKNFPVKVPMSFKNKPKVPSNIDFSSIKFSGDSDLTKNSYIQSDNVGFELSTLKSGECIIDILDDASISRGWDICEYKGKVIISYKSKNEACGPCIIMDKKIVSIFCIYNGKSSSSVSVNFDSDTLYIIDEDDKERRDVMRVRDFNEVSFSKDGSDGSYTDFFYFDEKEAKTIDSKDSKEINFAKNFSGKSFNQISKLDKGEVKKEEKEDEPIVKKTEGDIRKNKGEEETNKPIEKKTISDTKKASRDDLGIPPNVFELKKSSGDPKINKLQEGLNKQSIGIDKPSESYEDNPEKEMMDLIGQDNAKAVFRKIRAYISKNDTQQVYKNIVFFGENGVGKSTVGRLIAKILYKYKAVQKDIYTERNAKELYNNFTGYTKENLESLYKEGEGGVILIDDFHYLGASNNSNIKEGLITLSNLMGKSKSTVFIICDNRYNMMQILDNYKDLFQDRIRFRVDFKDFTRDELRQILEKKTSRKGYTIIDDAMDKLLEVIFLSKTFGNAINASAATSILEEVIVIQNVRTENTDNKEITVEDVDTYIKENDIAFIDQKTGFQSDARKRLEELIGLTEIKETIDDLIAYFSMNRGKKVDFHMAFTGSPGTGKTEVARIVGKILCQEGILSTSKFYEVSRRDLVGQYVGQSAIITRDIINKAIGGVLYIDEAYALALGGEKDFGREVIAELLKAMEDRRGEFCVILAGYTNEMKQLFDTNPGFFSRIKYTLEFPNYSDEELVKIAKLFLKRENKYMTDENVEYLISLISPQRKYRNFANARTLREYISKITIKQAKRIKKSGEEGNDSELTRSDIEAVFTKDEIEMARQEKEDKKKAKKPSSNVLLELYGGYKPVPFLENKDILSESILALKMSGDKSGEGTGFIISKDGYYLTCAHCVNGAQNIKARRRIVHRGKTIDIYYDTTVVSVDSKADVALCKLNTENNEEFDYLVLAEKDKQLDKLNKVYLLGYPFGVSRFDELSINEGKIASYQKSNSMTLGQINLDIQAKGGNSGSPILDGETSMVIGILCGSSLSRGNDITEEINYARPVEYVYELLDREEEKQ